MKKKHLITLTTAALTLTAIANQLEPSVEDANACNTLGLDLLQSLDQQKKNICLSPYSIQSALLMTQHGADKETLLEMQKVLHIDSHPEMAVKWHSLYAKEISQRLEKKIPSYQKIDKTQLTIANRIFLEQSYKPEQSFLDLCKMQYNAPVESLDFKTAADQSRLHINQWVSEQTNEKIKDLLGKGTIKKDTKMVLTNCLYFKASWAKAFDKKNTKPMPFHHTEAKQSMVDTMHLTYGFGYKKAANYQALTMPFGAHKNFQMLIVLPNEGTALEKVTAGLKQADLQALAKLRGQKVALALPKFKLESSSISLKQSLTNLGMKTAFTNKANFSKMATANDLKIADVVHKTYIAIDEGGAEAAAATAVVMAFKSSASPEVKKPIEFKVNRPFFFAIQDRSSGHCYFIGNVKNL